MVQLEVDALVLLSIPLPHQTTDGVSSPYQNCFPNFSTNFRYFLKTSLYFTPLPVFNLNYLVLCLL